MNYNYETYTNVESCSETKCEAFCIFLLHLLDFFYS